MKGDFSRVSFNAANHFSRVLMQQGRVTLDADHNEQGAIVLHMLRTLARDLFGPYGGPANGRGFGLYLDSTNTHLMIGAGHYYVNGILCENEQEYDYADQPDYAPATALAGGTGGDALLTWLAHPTTGPGFWIYLDVWERHVTWVEDARIREVALGGPDTCTRSKVVWQVKAMALDDLVKLLKAKKAKVDAITPQTNDTIARSAKFALDIDLITKGGSAACPAPLDVLPQTGNSLMVARLDPGLKITDPCAIAPDARYRGAENQLYRVEIHQGGKVGDVVQPTFKWSRDNGSVLTPWLGTDGLDLIVSSARGFAAGNWVELSDDGGELQGLPGLLVKIASVKNDRLAVAQDSIPQDQSIAWTGQLSHPKIRRWDQTENDLIGLQDGAVQISEVTGTSPNWITLEDGVQIQFAADGDYRSGDYWLIPARVATGSIEWPPQIGPDGMPQRDADNNVIPKLQPPLGIKHYYAPLGIIAGTQAPAGGGITPAIQTTCRLCCNPLVTSLCPSTVAPPAIAVKIAAIADNTAGASRVTSAGAATPADIASSAIRKRAAKPKSRRST